MKKLTFLILSTIITYIGISQITTEYIDPILTNGTYSADEDQHLVTRNVAILHDTLFLFLGGTGAPTWPYEKLSEFVANEGFAAVTLAYPNSVGTFTLTDSPDSLMFDNYHQEICYGESVSETVAVDTLNSIVTRTVNLLHYLDKAYPEENWSQFLRDSINLNWSKIFVGGHSQGSGHACYLSKHDNAARVIMLAGPNDYSNYFGDAANWLKIEGKTSEDHYYAYLNKFDEVVEFSKQLINLQAAGLCKGDTLLVDHHETFNDSKCLYTEESTGPVFPYHNAMIVDNEINRKVWRYMLRSPSTTTLYKEPEYSFELKIYPNPATSMWHVNTNNILVAQPYSIRNILGQVVMSGRLHGVDNTPIDCSSLRNGIYFLSVGHYSVKIIKQ